MRTLHTASLIFGDMASYPLNPADARALDELIAPHDARRGVMEQALRGGVSWGTLRAWCSPGPLVADEEGLRDDMRHRDAKSDYNSRSHDCNVSR